MADLLQLIDRLSPDAHEALVWILASGPVVTGAPQGWSDRLRHGVTTELKDFNLICSEVSLASEWQLTPLGERAAKVLRRSMRKGPVRLDLVQQEFLDWVDQMSRSSCHAFIGTPVQDREVSERELEDVLVISQEQRLLHAGHPDSFSGEPQWELTPLGRRAVHSGVAPRHFLEAEKRGGSIVNNDYSQANKTMNISHSTVSAAAVGDSISQKDIQTSALDMASVRGLMHEARQALMAVDLTPKRLEAIRTKLDEIEESAEEEARAQEPDRDRLKGMVSSLLTGLAVEMSVDGMAGFLQSLGTLAGGF